MITKFDKPTLNALRPEINAALQEVAAKHGITIKLGNGTYTSVSADFKVSLKVEGAAESELDNWALFHDLPKGLFGRTFKSGGETYTISGVKPRSSKFPILATNSQGKTYKFPVETVRQGLGS